MSDIKLFDEWSFEEIEIEDEGLKRYINLEPIVTPKSRGRHSDKQFYKADVNIIERVLNRMYVAGHRGKKHKITSGQNIGKSQKLWKILKRAFKEIEEETGENPLQVLVKALENSAPMEEVVTYQRGGIMARKAVVVAPQRRVDLALRMIIQGAYENRLANDTSAEEAISTEVLKAYNQDKCRAIREKERREREAEGAR